jgi:DNA recombination protein Rad52
MAFTDTQTRSLQAKLNAKHVQSRTQDGRTLSYIEGWHAITEANRIFGFDGWDRETVEARSVWEGHHGKLHLCAYIARVRIRVRAGDHVIVREGCGSGHGRGLIAGEAHESALKEAETDATKRALSTFGSPFGLALYDKSRKQVTGRKQPGKETNPKTEPVFRIFSNRGRPSTQYADPRAYSSEVRQRISEAPTREALEAFWSQNEPEINSLRERCPGLKNRDGAHFVTLLHQLFVAKRAALSAPEEAPLPPLADPSPPSIDKSKLELDLPKRRRDKDHLRYVASQPCLICDRLPSQAHHIRFAQPRAMSKKVSDEFAVPLCPAHHSEIHQTGNEASWWQARQIDPLETAEKLWSSRQGNGQGPAGLDFGSAGGGTIES